MIIVFIVIVTSHTNCALQPRSVWVWVKPQKQIQITETFLYLIQIHIKIILQ